MIELHSARARMMVIACSGWLVAVTLLVLVLTSGIPRLVLTAVLVVMGMVLLGLLLAGVRRTGGHD